MAQYYSIRIGPTIYLTDTGLVGGLGARLQLINWEALINPMVGNSIRANTGRPIRQTLIRPKGDRIEIQIETYLMKTIWDSIIVLINNCNTTDVSTTLTGVGDTGNFTNIAVKPLLDAPYSAPNFRDSRIIAPIFRFETV